MKYTANTATPQFFSKESESDWIGSVRILRRGGYTFNLASVQSVILFMYWLMKYWWSYRRGYTINTDWHQSISKRLSSSTFCLSNPWTTIKKTCVAIIAALATKKYVKRRRWTKEWLLKTDVYTHLNLVRGLWKLLSHERCLPPVQSRLTEIIKIFYNPSVQSINQRNKRSVSSQSDQDHGLTEIIKI
jgi:hypothetical protein